ncbi:MAG: sulfatase-like hydrolase/transferase [Planctomycetota bacterium]|jgi:arylsulfatase A-like enzyme
MSHTQRPNVLLILTDQQRWDCVGINGNERIRTPHLDGIARDGVSFQKSYTAAIACVPSRACIMSGQHVHTHGVQYTGGKAWLSPHTPTLPGVFRENGYRSVGVGKMHFKPWDLMGGFDERITADSKYDCSGQEDEYRLHLKANDRLEMTVGHHTPNFAEEFKAIPSRELPPEDHIDAYIGRRGSEALGGLLDQDQPWFLTVSFCSPHDPYDPPPPYDTLYDPEAMPSGSFREGELDILPDTTLKNIRAMGKDRINLTAVPEAKKREIAAYYYGLCTLIDDQVGELVRQLKDRGAYRDTVILFSSDHGEYLGDHNTYYKGTFLCDSDCKIPFLFKPAQDRGSTLDADRFTTNVDIMPTLLDAAGLTIPETCQGESLLSPSEEKKAAVTYAEVGPTYRLRTEEWAYVSRGGRGGDQLYRILDDPQELNNLAGDPDYQGVVGKLRQELLRWFMDNPTPEHLAVS